MDDLNHGDKDLKDCVEGKNWLAHLGWPLRSFQLYLAVLGAPRRSARFDLAVPGVRAWPG